MTIASFVGMLTFLDLGVGNALTNKVAQVASQNNPDAFTQYNKRWSRFLFILGCLVGTILISLASVLPWQRLIKVSDPLLHVEVRNAVMLFARLIWFYIYFPMVFSEFLLACSVAFEGHFVSAIGSIITLLTLWLAVGQKSGYSHSFGNYTWNPVSSQHDVILFLVKRRQFSFSNLISNLREESHQLLHIGGLFLLLQIGVMVGWGADSLIISSNLGASQVATFAIVQKLFQLATQPMSMLNAPLWGAYADAHARNEKQFIRKTLKRSMIITGIYAFTMFSLYLSSVIFW